MKASFRFLLFISLITITSCGIQKRQHLKGIYFPGRSHTRGQHYNTADKAKKELRFEEEKELSSNTKHHTVQELAVETERSLDNPLPDISEEKVIDGPDNDNNSITDNISTTDKSNVDSSSADPVEPAEEVTVLNPAAQNSLILSGLAIVGILSSVLFYIPLAGIVGGLAMIAAIVLSIVAIRQINEFPDIYHGLIIAKSVLYFWAAVFLVFLVLLLLSLSPGGPNLF